ncbi:hypothetical protein KC349_g2906 [Hortaea werneckii]|nr:hypothetical protein KC349_g2906 [Hortaea werneckii]
MLKELSGFDLFPPGVAADDSIFDFASIDPIAIQSGYNLAADPSLGGFYPLFEMLCQDGYIRQQSVKCQMENTKAQHGMDRSSTHSSLTEDLTVFDITFETSTTKANPEFKSSRSTHEFLTAVHISTGEAEEDKTRYVEATHYCAHVRKDLRQCLIYDSHDEDARLIGVEHMVPKHVYDSFPPEEQKLWHSHDIEVKSDMLILPKPLKLLG